MSNKTTVSYVSGAAPMSQYLALRISVDSIPPGSTVSSVNYMTFPGSEITDTPTSVFENGSIPVTDTSAITDNGKPTYIIYIPVSGLTPFTHLDTYIIANVIFSNGLSSDYSDSLQIFLPPSVPLITDAFHRIDPCGNTTTLFLIPDMESLPINVLNGSYLFNVAYQYRDSSLNWVFDVSNNFDLSYCSCSTSDPCDYYYIAVPFIDSATDIYCAAQLSLSYYDQSFNEYFSISQLSDTVKVDITGVPSSPRNLTSQYNYPAPTVTNNWEPPISDCIINVDFYRIYSSIGDPNNFTVVGTVLRDVTTFTYTLPTDLISGTEVYFYVTAVNYEGESEPSNITQITAYASASAPRNFAVTSLLDNSGCYVNSIFIEPLSTNGTPVNYIFNIYNISGTGFGNLILSADISYNPTQEVYYDAFTTENYPELYLLEKGRSYVATVSLLTEVDGILLDGKSAVNYFTVATAPDILDCNQVGDLLTVVVKEYYILSRNIHIIFLGYPDLILAVHALYDDGDVDIAFNEISGAFDYDIRVDLNKYGCSGKKASVVVCSNISGANDRPSSIL